MRYNNNNAFIDKARAIYGDTYDYKLVKYKHSHNKVEIICKRHGVFEQSPSYHLQGNGCPYCRRKRLTRDEFINEMKIQHKNKYDYSKCDYTHKSYFNDPILITCKEHGDFTLTIKSHLAGSECPQCRNMENSKKKVYQDNSKKKKSQKLTANNKSIEISYSFGTAKIYISGGNFTNDPEAQEHFNNLLDLVELLDGKILHSSIKTIEPKKSFFALFRRRGIHKYHNKYLRGV